MMTNYGLVKDIRTLYDDARTMERDMPERTDWEEEAKRHLRGEMARRGVTYAGLAERLAAIGVEDNERNLRNKVSRGKFTAGFLLQVMAALGAREIRLG